MLENPADPEILRRSLQTHRALLAASLAAGGQPNLGKVTSLDVRLDVLIDGWDLLDDGEQRDLARVVRYLVRVPDDVNDISERKGLDDDEVQVEQLIARLHARVTGL